MSKLDIIWKSNFKKKQVEKALQVTNQFRFVTGQKGITDLPKGVRYHPRSCVLAKAFNKDASVQPNRGFFRGRVTFIGHDSEVKARRLAEVLGTKATSMGRYSHTYRVKLPRFLGRLARDFDAGRYPEYDNGVRKTIG